MSVERIRVAALIGVAFWGTAGAAELLTGTVSMADGASAPFSIHGESRKEVTGGSIVLGEHTYVIDRVSRHGLIGGARDLPEGGREYVVFSSSFSEQTAVGKPWVAARTPTGCDMDYNSFIAIYQLGEERVRKLGRRAPYGVLTDDTAASDESSVHCFMSARGAGQNQP